MEQEKIAGITELTQQPTALNRFCLLLRKNVEKLTKAMQTLTLVDLYGMWFLQQLYCCR